MNDRIKLALSVLQQLRKRKDWGTGFDAHDLLAAATLCEKRDVLLDRMAGFFAGSRRSRSQSPDVNECPVCMAEKVVAYLEGHELIAWEKIETSGYIFTQRGKEKTPTDPQFLGRLALAPTAPEVQAIVQQVQQGLDHEPTATG